MPPGLSRSKGFSNGKFTSEGASSVDLERNMREQEYSLKNPHTNFDDWERLRTNQQEAVRGYERERNSSLNSGTLSDYMAGTAKDLFNRGGKRRHSSRKYKKSAKRVFRKKSRATRRR